MTDRAATLALTRAWLPRVSRSFAPSIAQLGEPLESAVGVAYLLCRIVDTVEDEAALGPALQAELFEHFRSALAAPHEIAHARAIETAFGGWDGDDPALCRESRAVFAAYASLSSEERAAMAPWIDEMATGMARFQARRAGGPLRIESRDDLVRYCYYVAGTVGHLLTGLFALHTPQLDGVAVERLTARAEEFALALQLVNMVKDVASDQRKGRVFLPLELTGPVAVANLLDAAHRDAVSRAHEQMCDMAETNLRGALEYTCLLPPGSSARRFCAVPLLLARATLREVKRNRAVFEHAGPVKISRPEAMELVGFVATRADDESALRLSFERLEREVFSMPARVKAER